MNTDLISRADAEALFRNARGELHKSAIRNEQNGHPIKDLPTRDLMLLNAEQMIHLLPSVTPTQRTGHWIETAEEYYKAVNEYGGGVNEDTPYFVDDIACSECLSMFSVIDNETERFDCCPHCGTKMVEQQGSCDTCKHKDEEWDSEPCDGCCGNRSGFEPQESETGMSEEISREEIAALLARESEEQA